VAVSAADGDVLVDFGPTPRTPSLEGTISHDGSNLYFSVTVLEQDAADDDYLAFWVDADYLNKDLSGMVNLFDSPWNEHSKLLMLNFFTENTDPEWGDGTGGNCPWMQTGALPLGVSLTYTDTDDGMNWEGTIPFSVLGISAGDTFGYMFAARINTDDKYVDGYPEPTHFPNLSGWDLRDYNTVTIPLPPPTTFIITASAGANGTIDPVGEVEVIEGADQLFTITPDEGYEIADVLVDDVSVGAGVTYTFVNVTADHTIDASFAQIVPPTKAEILEERGVPGRGLDKAPGLQKPFNPKSQATEHAGKKK